jgi:hypothetical protein
MKKALIEPSGRVAQVEPINPAPGSGGIPFPVAAPLVWRDCPDDTTLDHVWNGTGYDAPPPPPQQDPVVVARLQQDAEERGACAIDAQILPLVNQTKAEWITWAGSNFPSLTAAERTRLGILFWVVSVGVRRAIRNSA